MPEKNSSLIINTPDSLKRRALNESIKEGLPIPGITEPKLVSELERKKLQTMIDFLEHPGLQDWIHEGKITLAGIKPQAQESKLGVSTDDEGERALLDMIESPLQVVFSVSVIMNSRDVDFFYGDEIRKKLLTIPERGRTVWDIYKDNMMNGPATFLLLYEEGGEAVEKWRERMGATNPENADPDTIRGKYALETSKNLVHGSSGGDPGERRENVAREVEWLTGKLIKIELANELIERVK